MVVPISVGLAAFLILSGIIGMIFAGIRSMTQGKQDFRKMIIMAIPFVIFGIAYAVLGDFAKAGVITTLALMGVMVIGIAFTGLRGTFKF
ncbi:MAG: hypothetical protein AAFW89_08745 [Bacteroidota bacterium]